MKSVRDVSRKKHESALELIQTNEKKKRKNKKEENGEVRKAKQERGKELRKRSGAKELGYEIVE